MTLRHSAAAAEEVEVEGAAKAGEEAAGAAGETIEEAPVNT